MPYIIAIVVLLLIGIGFTFFQSPKAVETAVVQTEEQLVTTPENQVVTSTESSDQAPIEAEDTVVQTKEQLVTTPKNQVVTSTESSDQAPIEATIPDGTHHTTVTYFTPKRDEYTMVVSLTSEKGIITNSSIVYSDGAEVDPNAKRFDGAYKNMVIGKSIEDISLSRVGGASLTTNAFNEAVKNIVAENT